MSEFDLNSPAALIATLKADQENQARLLARLESAQTTLETSIAAAVERIEKCSGGRLTVVEEKVSKLENWKGWVAGATISAVFVWEALKDTLLKNLGGGNHP